MLHISRGPVDNQSVYLVRLGETESNLACLCGEEIILGEHLSDNSPASEFGHHGGTDSQAVTARTLERYK